MKARVKDRKMHVDFQDAKLCSQKWNRQDTPNYFMLQTTQIKTMILSDKMVRAILLHITINLPVTNWKG